LNEKLTKIAEGKGEGRNNYHLLLTSAMRLTGPLPEWGEILATGEFSLEKTRLVFVEGRPREKKMREW